MTTPRKLDDNLFGAHKKQGSIENAITAVTLDNKQKNAWDMTRSALLWNCPAFTHILYTMMSQKDGSLAIFTKDIPTAGTDGASMIINPDWFFKLPLPQRVFVAAHEILHAILDHCGQAYVMKQRGYVLTKKGKKLTYDHRQMNVAQDLVINDILIESKIGDFVKEGCHDKTMGVFTDSAIDVYEKLEQEKKKGGGKDRNQFDTHMEPGTSKGKSPTEAIQGRSPLEWDMAVAAGTAQAKAQGKLPGALERLFREILEPNIPWEEKIKGWVQRKLGSETYDWRKADRRLIVRDIYAPGRTGFGAGLIVVGVDTSGSMGQAELDRCFAELRGVLEGVKPRSVMICWCDAMLHKVDEIDDVQDLGGLKPKGGGGTDFRPVFDFVEKEGLEPDAMIYLTDGYGGFPANEPKYPVLWGALFAGVKYPFGEVVDIPIK